jgi:RES domain-containing protein
MTVWYRAAQTEKIEDIFSGDGGLYVAGRWNFKGRKVVYCSESISLCTLEWLSHNGLSVSGFCYYRFSIHIPSSLIITLNIPDLPKVWNLTPATDKTRDFAEKTLFDNSQYLAMAIPSIMVPEEFNLVINPLHESYKNALKTVCALGRYVAPRRD